MSEDANYLVTWMERGDDGPLVHHHRVRMKPEEAVALAVTLERLEDDPEMNLDSPSVDLEKTPISIKTFNKELKEFTSRMRR
jgi:hypothetical protein